MKRDFILADNQDITRIGLESLIRTAGFEYGIFRRAADRDSLSGLLRLYPASVIVIDYTLFDFYGPEQLLNLASRYDHSSWVLFSEELGRGFIRAVCSRPQFSVIMKGDPGDEISGALKSVYNYGVYLCEFAEKILNEESADQETEKLTAAEVSVLREIAMGRTTKEIAAGRCLSFHTVNSHRKNIFRKLAVNNVQEAIRYALRAGIIDMADYNI